MQGPWLKTLQKYGVHGLPSSTLQGVCENGTGLICRRRASALAVIATATRQRIDMTTMRRSMQRHLERQQGQDNTAKTMMIPANGIKPCRVHIRAFMAASSAINAASLGWSRMPSA